MAKKKRGTKKKGGRRRRSVGSLNLNSPVVKLLAVGGGFFMGDFTNTQVDKIIPIKPVDPAVPGSPDKNNTMKTVGSIGLGGLLLMNKKGSKLVTGVTTVAGGILAGAGLRRALKQMGVIKGYQSVPVIGKHRMAGYQNVPVIGNGTPSQLRGVPGQLQGYRVGGGLGQNGYGSQGSGVMGSVMSANANGSGLSNSGSGYMG